MEKIGRQKVIEMKRHPAEILRDMLDSFSKETNREVEGKYNLNGLLRSDASINPEGYRKLYGEKAIQADADSVRQCELDFSGALLPEVQKFYENEYGIDTKDGIIAKWRENKSREKNVQMEMAITLLLSQKLGKDFLVVRTAPFDDYKGGADNLIIDCVTGKVVGAFDEVHESGDGKRTEDKKAKIQVIARKGGAKIRYGIKKLSDGKLVRASLEGVPVFYLGLEKSELPELIEGLSENNQSKTDKIFKKLLASLATQKALLEKSTSSPEFGERLKSFGESILRLMGDEEEKVA
jgi:hypothetical protein